MVGRIEAGTHAAIAAMERVTGAAGDSATKADVAEGAILEIVDGVAHTSHAVGDISIAITEQASAVEQASQALNDMSASSDRNYQAALELAGIADRIGTAERNLAQGITRFRL